MRRTLAGLLVLVLSMVLPGCGVRATGIVSAGDKPLTGAQVSPVTVYLLRRGRLVRHVRPGLPGRPFHALVQLGIPLTAQEIHEGLTTAVPPGPIHPVPDDLLDGVLRVEMEGDVFSSDGRLLRARWSRAAVAQVVCTGEAIPGIATVDIDARIRIFEEPPFAVYCKDFADLQ